MDPKSEVLQAVYNVLTKPTPPRDYPHLSRQVQALLFQIVLHRNRDFWYNEDGWLRLRLIPTIRKILGVQQNVADYIKRLLTDDFVLEYLPGIDPRDTKCKVGLSLSAKLVLEGLEYHHRTFYTWDAAAALAKYHESHPTVPNDALTRALSRLLKTNLAVTKPTAEDMALVEEVCGSLESPELKALALLHLARLLGDGNQ